MVAHLHGNRVLAVGAAAGFTATIALHLGDERFQLRIADGELTVARGETDHPDVTVATDQAMLLSLLRTDIPLDEALAGGDVRLVGDRAVVERFRRLFPSHTQYRSPPAALRHHSRAERCRSSGTQPGRNAIVGRFPRGARTAAAMSLLATGQLPLLPGSPRLPVR